MSFRSISGTSISPYNRSIVDNDPELCAPLQLHTILGQEYAALNNNNVDKLLLIVRVWIAGKVLELGMETKFTALVLLHRYWNAIDSQNSISTSQHDGDDWKWVAASCLFLACKAEEEPRRLRDVINVAYMLQFGIDGNGKNQLPVNQQRATKAKSNVRATSLGDPSLNSNGDNGTNDCNSTANGVKDNDNTSHENYILLEIVTDPPPLDDTYWKAKEQLVATEQRVLRWLHFDVIVSHPHRMVLILVKELITTMTDSEQQRQQQASNDPLLLCDRLISLAWQRLNDSLFYGPALTHSAMHMACVAISLAATALVEVATTTTTTTTQETELQQTAAGHGESDQPTSFAMETTSAAAVVSTDHHHPNLQQEHPQPAEIALLNMLAGNPTWWRRYDISDEEFRDTQGDMCRATEILGQMKITVN